MPPIDEQVPLVHQICPLDLDDVPSPTAECAEALANASTRCLLEPDSMAACAISLPPSGAENCYPTRPVKGECMRNGHAATAFELGPSDSQLSAVPDMWVHTDGHLCCSIGEPSLEMNPFTRPPNSSSHLHLSLTADCELDASTELQSRGATWPGRPVVGELRLASDRLAYQTYVTMGWHPLPISISLAPILSYEASFDGTSKVQLRLRKTFRVKWNIQADFLAPSWCVQVDVDEDGEAELTPRLRAESAFDVKVRVGVRAAVAVSFFNLTFDMAPLVHAMGGGTLTSSTGRRLTADPGRTHKEHQHLHPHQRGHEHDDGLRHHDHHPHRRLHREPDELENVLASRADAAGHTAHACEHDGVESSRRQPKDYFHSPQSYSDHLHSDGDRRLSGAASSSVWAPVRIVTKLKLMELDATLQSWVQSTLLRDAIEWVTQALRVRTAHQQTRLTPGRQCYIDLENDGSVWVTSDQTEEASADNADFVLYVYAVAESCGMNTLAWATTCVRDQYDRPIVGLCATRPPRTQPVEMDCL